VCATSMCSRTLLPERVQSHGSLVTFKLELGNVKIADSDGRYRVWNVISKTFNYLNKEAGVSRSALKSSPCLRRTLLHHSYSYALFNKISSAKPLCSANRVCTSSLCMSPIFSEIVLLTISLKPSSSSMVVQKA
jgi:hypothetical protein